MSTTAPPQRPANGTAARPTPEMLERRDAVLKYWFGTTELTAETEITPRFDFWFGGGEAVDKEVSDLFRADVENAIAGRYFSWTSDALSTMALVILLDQFPLNLYRETPDGFEASARAVPIAYTAIARGFDKQLPKIARLFMYLPLEHSELLADQEKCVQLHEECGGLPIEYAIEHRDVVKKYGRFPGRNAIYKRETTEDEQKYLDDGGVF